MHAYFIQKKKQAKKLKPMGFVVYKMLTECLYKIGTWCHQLDKIIDSDETVMLLMLLTCKKKQQEFFPFMPSKSKHMVKARGECV